jgi:hypothetical protein
MAPQTASNHHQISVYVHISPLGGTNPEKRQTMAMVIRIGTNFHIGLSMAIFSAEGFPL